MASLHFTKRQEAKLVTLEASATTLVEHDLFDYELEQLYDLLAIVDMIRTCLYLHFKKYLRPIRNDIIEDIQEGQAVAGSIVDEKRKRISQLKSRLDNIQSAARTNINTLSRPHLRSLTIMDLPPETLTSIFEYARGEVALKNYPVCRGTADIKRIRLVCHHFYNHSSHLLMPIIWVGINSPQLARLEEISRHRLIRKGIRHIILDTRFFSSVLASDIVQFATFRSNRLQQDIDWQPEVRRQYPELVHEPEEIVEQARRSMLAMLSSWSCHLHNTPDDCENPTLAQTHVLILQRAYRAYCRGLSDQQKLLRHGTFNRRLAHALARMPALMRLKFEERGPPIYGESETSRFVEQASDSRILIQQLALPSNWYTAETYGLGDPPSEMFLSMPISLHKAEVFLTNVELTMYPLKDYSILSPSSESQRQLATAMHRLKSLKVSSCGHRPDAALTSVEIARLGEFLAAMCSSQQLEQIHISVEYLLHHNTNLPSLGPCIPKFMSPKLKKLRLISVPFHLTELGSFVDQLLDSTISGLWLTLEHIHLVSGSWAEALDVLRERHAPSKVIIEIIHPRTMDDWENTLAWAVFDKTSHLKLSEAEKYIRRELGENPLRAAIESNVDSAETGQGSDETQ